MNSVLNQTGSLGRATWPACDGGLSLGLAAAWASAVWLLLWPALGLFGPVFGRSLSRPESDFLCSLLVQDS